MTQQYGTTLDGAQVMAQLRAVGGELMAQFRRWTPVIELDEMYAAFRLVDDATAAAMRARLSAMYPRIGWLDIELDDPDEALAQMVRGEYWLFDAIDGAVQFVRAIPNWCMTLTLLRDGVAVFVAVYDVMHDEMFHAQASAPGQGGQGGAFLNGAAIRVNGRASHHNGVLATSQPPFVSKYPLALERAGSSLTALLPCVAAVRNLGPTSLQLAYVACGRLDAFWEFGPDGCNCIGAALLVREAGGLATDAAGAHYALCADSIVAAPPGAHASMLLRLGEALAA